MRFCTSCQKYAKTYQISDSYTKIDGTIILIVEHHCFYCLNLIFTEEKPDHNGTDNSRRS